MTRPKLRRFVVIFPGRVGSTYLISALDAHPHVRVEGEVLEPLKPRGAAAQLDFTQRYLRGPLLGRHHAIGFKTKLRDVVDQDAFRSLLEGLDVRVVAMYRRNEVKTAVSRLRGRELQARTGRWNRHAGDAEIESLLIEPAKLDEMLRAVELEHGAIAAFLEHVGTPRLRVDYEDLLIDPDAVFRGVLDFVGVARLPLAAETRKNTSDDLRQAVTNFEELRAHYAGTRYEAMFDEVLVGSGV